MIGKVFLVAVSILQLMFCCILFLCSIFNIEILHILRFIVGVVHLTLIPGILILHIFKFQKLNLETFLYSIGLSQSFLMFIGFLLNVFLPEINIKKPITWIPLLFTVSTIIIFMLLLIYIKGYLLKIECRNFIKNTKFSLFLMILLLLTGIGSFRFLYYSDSLILLITLLITAVIPVYTYIKVSTKMYPIVIWFISLILLFYGSLGSKYVPVIGDPHVEYFFANMVRTTGIWNTRLEGTHNAMVEVTILQPIYSVLLGLDITWTFKLVYPLIFSFCPLVLYLIYKYQFNSRVSFVSTLIPIFSFQFYNAYANSTRWGIAFLFMSLIVLAIISDKLKSPKKELLVTIYSLSLIISHYTTSYIFMFTIIFACMFYNLLNIRAKPNCSFVIFYIISTIGYYIYVAQSSAYNLIFAYSRHVVDTIKEDILSPSATYVGYAIKKQWPLSVEITMYFIYLFIFLSLIGLLITLYHLKFKKYRLNIFYIVGSIAFIIYIFISILGMFGPPRAFFMSLLFTAPFMIKTYQYILRKIEQRFIGRSMSENKKYIPLLIILAVYFLFSSGFISEVITKDDDYSPTVFISKNRENLIKDPYFTIALARRYIPDVDVYSAHWISKYRDPDKKIYVDTGTGDGHAGWVTLQSYGMIPHRGNIMLLNPYIEIRDGYVYLRKYNIENKLLFKGLPIEAYSLTTIGIQKMDKLYTNGGSEVYYMPFE